MGGVGGVLGLSDPVYVSRGGQKLAHALGVFGVDVRGAACADLGCSTGGFTDCLLQHGAAKVYAVDTAYGQLAWKLRKDPRVVVMERQNALHAAPEAEVDLVVVDLGWTPQSLLMPAALSWLNKDSNHAAIITLIKPHYEAKRSPFAGEAERHRGVLPDELAGQIKDWVVAEMPAMGVQVESVTESPLRGGTKADGNLEWLAKLTRARGAA